MLFPVLSSDNWLDNAFDDFFNTDWMPRVNTTAPAVNVKTDAQGYTMEIAVAGLKKDDCKVSLDEDGNLEVKLEGKHETTDDNKHEHYLRREFSYGSYQQSYSLPNDVDKDNISAKVEDGILTIRLPKANAQAKVQKTIEVG